MQEKIYKMIQESILAKLEKGTIPWKKSWSDAGGMAKNIITNKVYRGINQFMLGFSEYNSPYWMTYKQAKQRGGNIKKGEKGSLAVYYKFFEKVNEETGEVEKRFPMIRYYKVFNLEQTEKVTIPKRELDEIKKYNNSPIDNCEQVVNEMREMPEIIWGKAPCYIPSQDKIGMPKLDHFQSAQQYYAVMFHEMAHSTKAMHRMNRDKPSYAKEELIAEMSACFICGMVGIDTALIDNSAAYLKSWRDRIKKNDPKLIVQAASEAQKVSNWILNINQFTELKDEKKAA